MISAGQTPYGPQQSGYPPGAYQQQPQGPTFLPATAQPPPFQMSMPNMTVTGKLGEEATKDLMWGQFWMNAGGAAANMVNSIMNYKLAASSMEKQAAIAGKYYDTQDKMASYQMEVAIKQLGVQGAAIEAQKTMHGAQIRHEEQMQKLEGATQRQLKKIAENGMSERTRIMSMTDAFSRRGWDMGTPAFA